MPPVPKGRVVHVGRLTEDAANADWTKQAWDVDLPQDLASLRAWLAARGIGVEHFKQLPLYRLNVGKLRWLSEL